MTGTACEVAEDGCAREAGCGHVLIARGRQAVCTAHPEATRVALALLAEGGSAVDAAIGAQAVIATVMPHAAGLGGDMLALVRTTNGNAFAVNGVGRSPSVAPDRWLSDGGSSVTVPGLVDGWLTLHRRGGRLPLSAVLAPAAHLAQEGYTVDPALARATDVHRQRLHQNGSGAWSLLGVKAGEVWRQPELGALLQRIGYGGRAAVYCGDAAEAVCAAAQREGGTLRLADLDVHRTSVTAPVQVEWDGGALLVQPPPTQGILLAMAAAALQERGQVGLGELDHLLIELTGAAFAHRSDIIVRGRDLLREPLAVDSLRASRRGGARSYLHTAGVAVCDGAGTVVSSLVSVFDDFGSAVVVPELGIVLANRAAGFTDGANLAGPGRLPVHTLAPAIVVPAGGGAVAVATPGADGQVQTLLQVLAAMRYRGDDLAGALARPRWRSEDGRLLVEAGHQAIEDLRARGHDILSRARGEDVFGAVVAAGWDPEGSFAVADSRRAVSAGASS